MVELSRVTLMNKSEKLERLREKLHKSIDKHGLNAPETRKISVKLDKLINEQYEHEVEYPVASEIKDSYYKSIEVLKETVKDTGHFPCVSEWNKYAAENGLLSHISIEYIMRMNWSELDKYIRQEIK